MSKRVNDNVTIMKNNVLCNEMFPIKLELKVAVQNKKNKIIGDWSMLSISINILKSSMYKEIHFIVAECAHINGVNQVGRR